MSLRRETLRSFFDASPTVKLLRSALAPLVVDFLHQTFKLGESISIGQSELRTRLLIYQEELHQDSPTTMIGTPERYLADWIESGWLMRFLEANSSEPQFQLTRFSEEALRFVESALAKSNAMVGTESRLKLIIETLGDIVRGASADPERRLAYLKAQRDTLDQQIAEIESGKSIEVYRPAQIRERFQNAVDLLRTLRSDFNRSLGMFSSCRPLEMTPEGTFWALHWTPKSCSNNKTTASVSSLLLHSCFLPHNKPRCESVSMSYKSLRLCRIKQNRFNTFGVWSHHYWPKLRR
jgi:hypothetical protein